MDCLAVVVEEKQEKEPFQVNYSSFSSKKVTQKNRSSVYFLFTILHPDHDDCNEDGDEDQIRPEKNVRGWSVFICFHLRRKLVVPLRSNK